MDKFMPKERSLNFSKVEKDRFQFLIEKYKEILFCKKTDTVSNVKKNKVWAAIHAEFNAGGDQPRTLRQLKAKFDNMKRNARKDASQERQARIKTGGGPPVPPVQQETEWFRSVMPVSMDGLPSAADDDIIANQPIVLTISNEVTNTIPSQHNPGMGEINNVDIDEHKENVIPNKNITDAVQNVTDSVFDSKSPATLLRTPVSKPLRACKRSLSKKCNLFELKSEVFKKYMGQEEELLDLKMQHMKEKRQEEKETFEFKKKKLLLEISLLENKNNL